MLFKINWDKIGIDSFVIDTDVNQIVFRFPEDKEGRIRTLNPFMGLEMRGYKINNFFDHHRDLNDAEKIIAEKILNRLRNSKEWVNNLIL